MKRLIILIALALSACTLQPTPSPAYTPRPTVRSGWASRDATIEAEFRWETIEARNEILAETQMAEEELRRMLDADENPNCIDLAQAVNTPEGDYMCISGTIKSEVTQWQPVEKILRDGERTIEYQPAGGREILVSSDGRYRIPLEWTPAAGRMINIGGCQNLWGYFKNADGQWSFVFDERQPCSEIQVEAPPGSDRRALVPSEYKTQSGCPAGCSSPPPGCMIKGNISISSGEKIYHLPGQKWYNSTNISPAYGEAWFCTEAEAQANGFRRSYE